MRRAQEGNLACEIQRRIGFVLRVIATAVSRLRQIVLVDKQDVLVALEGEGAIGRGLRTSAAGDGLASEVVQEVGTYGLAVHRSEEEHTAAHVVHKRLGRHDTGHRVVGQAEE